MIGELILLKFVLTSFCFKIYSFCANKPRSGMRIFPKTWKNQLCTQISFNIFKTSYFTIKYHRIDLLQWRFLFILLYLVSSKSHLGPFGYHIKHYDKFCHVRFAKLDIQNGGSSRGLVTSIEIFSLLLLLHERVIWTLRNIILIFAWNWLEYILKWWSFLLFELKYLPNYLI